jgi:aminoglycoside phosphotransferase (APT) family kinase protein
MANSPKPDISVDLNLVQHLLGAQVPELGELELSHLTDGWDCAIWRLGHSYVVRLPIRPPAVRRLLNEQNWMAIATAAVVRDTDVAIPRIVHRGVPDAEYDRPWSIETWIPGLAALDIPIADRIGWAEPLAAALRALHLPAPAGYPENPAHGVPLAERDETIRGHLATVGESGVTERVDALERMWQAGIDAVPFGEPAVWMHGDLHAGNVVADSAGRLGLIDFGDVTAGDPAYDLASAWLVLGPEERAPFRVRYGGDDALWVRARAWAAATAATFLARSDDYPSYRRAGHEIVGAVCEDA